MPKPEGVEAAVTGIVLAGGRGRRMGGVDKGLALLGDRPMIEWVLERFAPQTDEVLIVANRNVDRYAAFGHRVVSDSIGDFAGPLAGLQRGMSVARHALVCTVPCDSPFLPLDLLERLQAPLLEGADAAVATAGGRSQPVFCLYRRSLLRDLEGYLASGERRVETWLGTLDAATVVFDDPAAFANINTPEELQARERARVVPPAPPARSEDH